MKVLSCAYVRRRLEAWHDRELAPAEQCAIDQHLSGCPPCAAEARVLDDIGAALRGRVADWAPTADVLAGLRAGVLGRATAEDALSWRTLAADLFEDMHFVWAGLSATAATLVCAAMLLGMAYFTIPGRDDSLAGIMGAMAEPELAKVQPPHSDAVPASWSEREEDLVFALAAVVTQEGRGVRSHAALVRRGDREAVLRLMNAVVAARFEPARPNTSRVPVDLVWLAHWTGGVRLYGVTHTTVRGKSLS